MDTEGDAPELENRWCLLAPPFPDPLPKDWRQMRSARSPQQQCQSENLQCLVTPTIGAEHRDVDGGAKVLKGEEGNQKASGKSAEWGGVATPSATARP